MEFQIPESVNTFLTDERVRAGINAALDYGPRKLPPGLSWDELPSYYAAVAAGQAVQAAFATALLELWNKVWPASIAGWRALSVDEQADDRPTIANIWDWSGWRGFERGAGVKTGGRLWFSVGLDEEGASVGFYSDLPGADAFNVDGFRYDSDLESWWTTPVPLTSRCVHLQTLRATAQDVLTWFDEAMA